MKGWPASVGLGALAVVFLVLGVLYWAGSISFLTSSGSSHAHHYTHAVASFVVALLCVVGANFARPKANA